MRVRITYKVRSGEVREKTLLRNSVLEAEKFFKWRYGHKVISVKVVEWPE